MSAREYIGRHKIYLTPAQESLGYPEARKHLAGYSDEDLTREYHELHRACFGEMFGHNAQKDFNLVVDELLARGITELPNIFGPIPVKHWKEAK
jgi:hypothetical protein